MVKSSADLEVTKREGLRDRDVKYTMKIARRRFKVERHLPAGAHGFRHWARKTYNASACHGKLEQLVGAK